MGYLIDTNVLSEMRGLLPVGVLDDFAFFLNLILNQHPVGVSLVVRLSPGLHADVHTGDTEAARGFQGFALMRVLRAQLVAVRKSARQRGDTRFTSPDGSVAALDAFLCYLREDASIWADDDAEVRGFAEAFGDAIVACLFLGAVRELEVRPAGGGRRSGAAVGRRRRGERGCGGLRDTFSEKDVESAILREIERFLLDLGAGFAFVERQKRITLALRSRSIPTGGCSRPGAGAGPAARHAGPAVLGARAVAVAALPGRLRGKRWVDGVRARPNGLGFREEMRMNWRERIESDPETLHGEPHVRGTDIPVSVVLTELIVHKDFQGVVACHPGLSEDDVGACVAWAVECVHTPERAQGPGGVVEADPEESPGPGEVAEAAPALPEGQTLMDVLLSMPDVGEDADFERPVSYGRADVDLV